MKYSLTEKYLSTKQGWQFLLDNMMGPNAMRVAEELASYLNIEENMRILDLGCGKGLSSILLNQKYNATVFAADLWITPSENYERFDSIGLASKIIPISTDATKGLPFAHNYFDILFSVDSYHYFGNNEQMLPSLVPFVKKGGYIAVAVPGLKKDFENGTPEELKPFFNDAITFAELDPNFYSPEWWQKLWSKTSGIEIVSCKEMQSHEKGWEEWLQSPNPYAQHDVEMMKAENGQYFNIVQIIAKVL